MGIIVILIVIGIAATIYCGESIMNLNATEKNIYLGILVIAGILLLLGATN